MKYLRYLFLVVLITALTASAACTTGNGSLEDDDDVREGPRPRDETIAEIHKENRGDIRTCFRKHAPEESAEVEVELHVPRSGTPVSIRLLQTENYPPALRVCLEQVFTQLEYGQGRRGATYYQVLTFDGGDKAISFAKPIDAYHRWGLTGDEIEAVFEQHEATIDQCYDLAANSPEGRILLTVAIDSTGRVARAGIKSSTLGAAPVDDCLVDLALELELPPPRGGGVVVFDLEFLFEAGEGWAP